MIYFRVRLGLLDSLGVVGPSRRDRRVAGLVEKGGPPIPAAREEPQAVYENDRGPTACVCLVDLLGGIPRYRIGPAIP